MGKTKQSLVHEIQAIEAAMNGPMVVRGRCLISEQRRAAHLMAAAVGLSPRSPHGLSPPDVIDLVSRSIMDETEFTCDCAGLDNVQSETLMEMSRRGIEAFANACGMALLEEIRAGNLELDWDEMLQRIDQILPELLDAENSVSPASSIGTELPKASWWSI